ncbi:FRG domain-containing protein [Vreelandella neptunia]|uniref:FRG domain-containing protein n=1 Tax=Vreelandella neptunia TaxID=115551 RepID=A0ABZ0YJB8_9GAMM|nr:FRG domain-containing protein [Halomonas neptunia]MDN3559795.1 FRG domain-containing protein [Halomonas neptunia]WQH11432.1 FRG domain-containing protein [Halomonas neptunia]
MYVQKDFKTARELIDYLSPLDTERWPRGHYVFRGQPCASYGLAPAAYRTKGVFTATSMFRLLGVVSGDEQVFFEVQVLTTFLKACDGAGIQVTGDSPELRKVLAEPDYYFKKPSEWPPEAIFSVLATAQHHGAPTCLLDWTRRSFVAAYFAAAGALRNADQPSHLAVWALSIHHRGSWRDLSFVEMPGGTSANLAAQAGVFTVSGIKATRGEHFESTALEHQDDVYRHQTGAYPGLVKLTLTIEEAGKLLHLCADLGVKGSVLFPGYEGAAREVNDYAYANLMWGAGW